MENSDKPLVKTMRGHDVAPSEMFAEFMKDGWSPTPLSGIEQAEVISHCHDRRQKLSAAFTKLRLVIPSGTANSEATTPIICIAHIQLLLITQAFKAWKLIQTRYL